MTLVGPETFALQLTPERCTVTYPNGARSFTGRATSGVPKLYVVTTEDGVEYVGVTRQPLSRRIRMGWTARGASGYYGYRWRHSVALATLSVWYQEGVTAKSNRELETIEAEVVYLVRAAGHWPRGQTEIHFYPSTEEHRAIARRVFQNLESRR